MTTDSAKRACVLCNGQLKNPEKVKQIANDCDLLIAADGHNTVANIHNLVHPKCVACGFANGNGLHLTFETAKDGSVMATFQCDEAFEGYPGILHGGIISLILDSAMGNCMFARGLATVTFEMTTKFRHPVIIGQEAAVSARITRYSHPLYLLEAKITQNGKVKAKAKGKYYDQPKLIDSD